MRKQNTKDVTKIIKLFMALGIIIHSSKPQLIPAQKIEYLGFVIDSVSMSVSLSNNKKKAFTDICEDTQITSEVTIRHIVRVLGKVSNNLLAAPPGRLHYRVLERFKTEALKEHKGNFDKIVIIQKPGLDHILRWKLNIPSSFAPIVRENSSTTINKDASIFGWGACNKN